mmetsp:Transcript_26986/g.34802  ORF Transcript_26986/g.34802 Transcript_26986/m.34802 type:complete len:689 (-) Transcript_26986:255-2321(-)
MMNAGRIEEKQRTAEARSINVNILLQCVNVLRKEGLEQPGLFRASINLTEVKKLWVDLCVNENIVLEEENPSLLASLILWHLRQLSEPLIPFKLHQRVMDLQLGNHESEDVLALKPLLLEINVDSWNGLKLLMGLLQEVSENVDVNEMSKESLAQIFAPLICRPPNTAFMSVRHVQSLKQIEQLVLLMIVHHQEFFGTPRKVSPCSPRSPSGALLGLSIEIPKAHHFVNPERSPAQLKRSLTASSDVATVNDLITSTVGRLFRGSLFASSSNTTLAQPPQLSTGADASEEGEVDVFEGHPVKVAALSTGGMGVSAGAVERRRMVAACRALRAQLTFFEDGWAARRGRRPRGSERAHMASTYAQYRVWKRNIRDDAALQIQIFWRTRMKKLSPHKAVVSPSFHQQQQQQRRSKPLIFSGILQTDQEKENFISPEKDSRRRKSQGQPQLLRSSSGQLSETGSSGGGGSILPNINNHKDQTPKSPIFHSNGPSSQKPGSGRKTPQINPKSPSDELTALLEEKRQVKEKLKQFDLRFCQEKGRMPTKAEKEPIRHLYEQYNLIKNKIKKLEIANSKKHFWGSPGAHSPPSQANSNNTAYSKSPRMPNKKSPHRPSHTLSPTSSPTPTDRVSEIENLKRTKRELHIMLKNYERQFKQQHGREVSSPDDIAPVEKEYQKYKEIKRKLMRLTAER